jgi:hypothetical protein
VRGTPPVGGPQFPQGATGGRDSLKAEPSKALVEAASCRLLLLLPLLRVVVDDYYYYYHYYYYYYYYYYYC